MAEPVTTLLDEMQTLIGAASAHSAPERWVWRREQSNMDKSEFEIGVGNGRVRCVVGHEAGRVDCVIVDGVLSDTDDEADEEVTLLWEEARSQAERWFSTKADLPGFELKASPESFWELTHGPLVHRIAPGTPPNKTEFPLTGSEPAPFWSLAFLMEDANA
jgi:hypothetical protein